MSRNRWVAVSVIAVATIAMTSCSHLPLRNEATPSSAVGTTSRNPTPEEVQQRQEQEKQRQREEQQAQEKQRQEQERERDAAATRSDPLTYNLISNAHDWAVLLKNPDAHAGEKYQIFGEVTQFDTKTGIDTFRAKTGNLPFDFETNSVVRARDASILADVVEKDLVRMYVEFGGTTDYRSTVGIEQTAPLFIVNMVDRCWSYDTLRIGPYKGQEKPIPRYPACDSPPPITIPPAPDPSPGTGPHTTITVTPEPPPHP